MYKMTPSDNASSEQQALTPEPDEELLLIREIYPAADAVARANGWDDPEMDIYNDYDAHKQEQ